MHCERARERQRRPETRKSNPKHFSSQVGSRMSLSHCVHFDLWHVVLSLWCVCSRRSGPASQNSKMSSPACVCARSCGAAWAGRSQRVHSSCLIGHRSSALRRRPALTLSLRIGSVAPGIWCTPPLPNGLHDDDDPTPPCVAHVHYLRSFHMPARSFQRCRGVTLPTNLCSSCRISATREAPATLSPPMHEKCALGGASLPLTGVPPVAGLRTPVQDCLPARLHRRPMPHRHQTRSSESSENGACVCARSPPPAGILSVGGKAGTLSRRGFGFSPTGRPDR